MIEGQCVIVRLSAGRSSTADSPGAASLVGTIRHIKPARYAGDEFSIGTPYPDSYPERLAGGVLFLDPGTFERARFKTFDDGGYFMISIDATSYSLLICDVNSSYP